MHLSATVTLYSNSPQYRFSIMPIENIAIKQVLHLLKSNAIKAAIRLGSSVS